ncbi:MAG: glutathione S-transferase family protein, partial [Acidobacteria bacterium]|nr:glutathione S-transferase family protein [Acidobacteriota bacterium]NIM60388.1 glutathione S-transferase family protein [Acidobacteriota bacterium]NIO60357.1 glutathione S-transferase family protein [Acidobacteriota bacterium]NIQ31425.1 glutathione S-transferase family protein [Acidobacteriota bacterium]NIQ85705.1 glutathione S-transferase family protein [Acidobacteriota bacterium]
MDPRPQYPREQTDDGEFRRQESRFRRWCGPEDDCDYDPAPGRYHLYVSYACPWAHRTLIFRKLKRLENVISMTVVDPIRDERGWAFRDGPGHSSDAVNGFQFLSEAYLKTDPAYAERVTVPVLWDKQDGRIVNNESSEIIRMLNSAFDEWVPGTPDFYPRDLREEIDAVNETVYANVNNGVYRAGFATRQDPYDRAIERLFGTLDDIEARLADRRYLVGDRLTEADWRLFTTLVRFDAVYVGHFKCNLRRIADYPNL